MFAKKNVVASVFFFFFFVASGIAQKDTTFHVEYKDSTRYYYQKVKTQSFQKPVFVYISDSAAIYIQKYGTFVIELNGSFWTNRTGFITEYQSTTVALREDKKSLFIQGITQENREDHWIVDLVTGETLPNVRIGRELWWCKNCSYIMQSLEPYNILKGQILEYRFMDDEFIMHTIVATYPLTGDGKMEEWTTNGLHVVERVELYKY
jgi:hypothetical protein